MPIGLLCDVRGLVSDEACVRWRLAVAKEDVAAMRERARGERGGRRMSRRILVHTDVAHVGAERGLDLASNVRGEGGARCLALHGLGCHCAVGRYARRGSNRQIHRQRALSDGTGAWNATRITSGHYVSPAPAGSIHAHAATVAPAPGLHHQPRPMASIGLAGCSRRPAATCAAASSRETRDAARHDLVWPSTKPARAAPRGGVAR